MDIEEGTALATVLRLIVAAASYRCTVIMGDQLQALHTARQPQVRELERAKRRGDRGGSSSRQHRERMVVWEEGKSAKVKDHLDDVRAMISANSRGVGMSSSSSHLNDRENRDNWDIDIHKKRGVASDGRPKRRSGRPQRLDSNGSMDDHEIGLNTGWAERLKMYLKTPRSRFSRNKPGRSRSKSPSKRGGNDSAATGNKDAGKQANASSDTKLKASQLGHRHHQSGPKSSTKNTSSATLHTAEGKSATESACSSTTDNSVVEGKVNSVPPASPSVEKPGALSSTFSPTTMNAESVMAGVKPSEKFCTRRLWRHQVPHATIT